MNLGVVIGMIKGWTWDKATLQFWPLCKSYMIFDVPKHSDYNLTNLGCKSVDTIVGCI
jgi:hypothetical protein